MSPSRTTLMFIAVVTFAVGAPFSGAAATLSATAPVTESGPPEAVESLQVLSHEAARETPTTARETPTTRAPVAIDGATVYAESADQVARVARALNRFDWLGLELPDVEVRYYSDFSGCADREEPARQRPGYLILGEAKYTIFMCGVEFTLLHELAHVWDHSHLTDDERDRFMAERDADEWSGVERARAGGEHLADVVAWGLQDGNARPSNSKPNDDASLREAFRLVTGRRPLS